MTYDIYINSSIGWPYSAQYVREELDKCKGKTCNVYISSLGGSVVDALQIRQLFRDHGDVVAHLHGFVASAATIIAMGAKQIVMGQFALFLMHRCMSWVEAWGQLNAEEIDTVIQQLEANRENLEKVDQTVASIYAARCGKQVKDVAQWMHDAAWLNAEECKERGLVDDICKDDDHPVMTDDIRGEFVACGFPLPEQGKTVRADRSLRSLIDGLRTLVTSLVSPSASQQNAPSNSLNDTTMNKDYINLMAALNCEGLPVNDGKVLLSDEQLSAIDNKLAELNNQLAALSDEKSRLEEQLAVSAARHEESEKLIAELKEQVANLQKQDGASTQNVEDVTADAGADYLARARESYKQLRELD